MSAPTQQQLENVYLDAVHMAEVVTGRQGGEAGGVSIPSSQNRLGDVRKTLPQALTDITEVLDGKLDDSQATQAGLVLLGAADAAAQRSALGLANHQLVTVDGSGIATASRFTAGTLDAKGAVWLRILSHVADKTIIQSLNASDTALVQLGFGASNYAFDGGRFQISTPDDGVNQFQVGGSVRATGGVVLPDYANDTAAAAGGVPLYGLYRTGTTLKIRSV